MASDITQDHLVWFDIGIGYPVPGKVIDFSPYHNYITIQTQIDNKTRIYRMDTMANIMIREETGADGVEDMVNLPDLNEAALLHNLKKRYLAQHIYTFTGSILVAVNPYKMFDIYGFNMVKRYEGHVLGSLPPHLFAIGNEAFMKMNKDNEKQVVVISGESGAGKTESTKLLLHYLAAVNRSKNNLITEQILEANPLLESFGNAKTIRNDNSSRFGKYVEVYFKNGAITGAKISEYLLEKSRIVTHSEDERSYHVFYEILVGMTERQKADLGLSSAENYFYLNQGGSCRIETKNDLDDYRALQSALQILNFAEPEQKTIFRILAAVLHMGNIFFKKTDDNYVDIGADAEIRWVSHLLDLDEQWLRQVLTMKVTEARGERVLSPYTLDQAIDARDAMSKSLYAQLFTWLVERVNGLVQSNHRNHSIAILDIFGFEDFFKNSFEQLCINYANETLQYYFNKHIFKLEQQEYSKEHINWTFIDFSDNQSVLDLIAKKPVGIIHLLDDESNFPKGTDESFLDKCHYNHYADDLYEKPRMAGLDFCIHHYAGKIMYNVKNFLEKNKDTLRTDVVELFTQSRNDMISQMFHDWRNRSLTKTVNKATGRFVTMRPTLQTVSARFHESLAHLIDTMSKCNPFFIRCIKPNNEKAPMNLKMPVVLGQLRYTGMLETIRIRKQGYPVRIKLDVFIDRYHSVLGSKKPVEQLTKSQYCEVILTQAGAKYLENFQIGLSKVFLKESFVSYLDIHVMRVQHSAAINIQRILKGTHVRNQFIRKRSSAMIIQKHVRGKLARKRWEKIRRGVILFQSLIRMSVQRRKFVHMRDEMRRRQVEEERLKRLTAAETKLFAAKDPRYKAPSPGKVKRVPTRLEQRAIKERAARSVVSVAHLEVPARLALLFGKQDEWQPLHSDRNIVTVIGNVQQKNYDYDLPKDIDAHSVAKLRNVFLKSPREWGMKTSPIEQPFLLNENAEESPDAVAIFKLILRFMNDANLIGWPESLLGNFLMQMVLDSSRLTDEVYCQLINQTWRNQNEANNERGWLLMSNCLSCFPPTSRLYKYLLKYVSDYGYNGFKSVCQHKLLQMMSNAPITSRTYPPCMLEWKANRKRAHMALEVNLSDGTSNVGHVDSWMNGEDFASHVLKSMNLMEGNHGWTVQLVDDNDIYELAGYDYVLDLISEMELPPYFSGNQAYFLVSSSTTKDKKSSKTSNYLKTQHNPNLPRVFRVDPNEMLLLPPTHFPNQEFNNVMSSRTPSELSPANSPTRSPTTANDGMIFSRQSKLNQRPATIGDENGLSDRSNLNSRYMKRGAPPPPVQNGHIANGGNMGLSKSQLNDRYRRRSVAEVSPMLSNSKLNYRYRRNSDISNGANGNMDNDHFTLNQIASNGIGSFDNVPNGHIPMGGHFVKSSLMGNMKPSGQSAKDKILLRNLRERTYSGGSDGYEVLSTGQPAPSEISRMVDELFDFDQVIDDNMDDLTDGPRMVQVMRGGGNTKYSTPLLAEDVGVMLEDMFGFDHDIIEGVDNLVDINQMVKILKGGGQGIPGVVQVSPPTGTGVMNLGINNAALGNQLFNPSVGVPSNMGAAPLNPGMTPMTTGYTNSFLAAQQLATQQATISHQQTHLNQAAHQLANQNAAIAQMEQQQQVLQAAVQQQALQNQLLQYSLQGEILKQQLQQMSQNSSVSPVSPTKTESTLAQHHNGQIGASPVYVPGNQERTPVQNLKEHYELKSPPKQKSPERKFSAGKLVKFSESVQTIPGGEENENSPVASPVVSPPPRKRSLKTKPESPIHHTSPKKQISESPNNGPASPSKNGPASPVHIPSPPKQISESSDNEPASPSKNGTTSPVHIPSPPPLSTSSKIVNGHLSDSDHSDHSDSGEEGTMMLLGVQVKIDRQKSMAEPSPPPTGNDENQQVEMLPGRAHTIRIGHVCWPPKVKQDHKNKVHVNKLFIDEKSETKGKINHKISNEEAHAQSMELITSRSISISNIDKIKKAAEVGIASTLAMMNKKDKVDGKPPEKIDTGVKINMKQRALLLQKSLSSINIKEPHSPPPNVVYHKEKIPHHFVPFAPIPYSESRKHKPEAPPPPAPFVSKKEEFEIIKTELLSPNTTPFYMYTRVPWQLQIRKEVFSPTERLDNPLSLALIFCQVVQDIFTSNCVRIHKDERVKMRSMLESHGVTPENYTSPMHKNHIRKMIVETAREWPTYFARLFPIMSQSDYVDAEMLGISHTGIRFIKRQKDFVDESLHVLNFINFDDVIDVTNPKTDLVSINVRGKQYIIISPRAFQIKQLIDAYCIDSEKGTTYVRALNTYNTRESTLLSFQSGDIIKVTNKNRHLAKGWIYGSLNGRAGMLPVEHVQSISRHEITRKGSRLVRPASTGSVYSEPINNYPLKKHSMNGSVSMSDVTISATNLDAKFTMMEFALRYFRESPHKYEMLRKPDGSIRGTFKLLETIKNASLRRRTKKGSAGKGDKGIWSWKDIAEMIKWTKSPIQASLLKWHSSTANKLALECFIAIMKYMGDYPLSKHQTDLDCVYIVLMACHNAAELRDEIYCQLCKQTTNNRSKKSDSGVKGWRLFAIIAAYFDCSEILRPYLLQYLQNSSFDSQREHHGLASIALTNFRKTLKYGGRKNVPSRAEIDAFSHGRLSKRQVFLLPGGFPIPMNVRSVTVAEDVIDDICTTLNVINTLEQNEYTIYYVVEKEHFHSPLGSEEYVFDISTELGHQNRQYHMLFQRTTWYYDIRYDYSELYIDVMFNQSRPAYLSGNLLITEQKQLSNQQIMELSRLAALQYKAMDRPHLPSLREVMELIPKGIDKLSDLPVQSWVNVVHDKLKDLTGVPPGECKSTFLEILSKWSLFGSKFFRIKSVADPRVPGPCLLAVNKSGIHFLNERTHVTRVSWTLNEVISTRRYKEDGPHALHVDLKVGSLMMQKIVRIETDQGADISRVIGQYIRVMTLDRQQTTTVGASRPSTNEVLEMTSL